MSERSISRLAAALCISLLAATAAGGILSLPATRAVLAPAVVMTLATIIVLWPLVTQAVFVIMQGIHREVVPRFWKVNDGWLVMVVLSLFPSMFDDQLVGLVHPWVQGLSSPPTLSSKLALYLLAARVVQMRLARWEQLKRAQSSASAITDH